LQLVLAVTVLGKEGCERDKSTQNVVNNERNMVEGGVAKFDDYQLTCVKMGSIFFMSLLKRTRISSNILAL
jgi:hypothetical protein